MRDLLDRIQFWIEDAVFAVRESTLGKVIAIVVVAGVMLAGGLVVKNTFFSKPSAPTPAAISDQCRSVAELVRSIPPGQVPTNLSLRAVQSVCPQQFVDAVLVPVLPPTAPSAGTTPPSPPTASPK